MGNFRSVSQKFWVKGLNAAHSELNQLPGILARISNLIYLKRGALQTCGGTKTISAYDGAAQQGWGPWTSIFYYLPTGKYGYYVGIQKDQNTHIGVPSTVAVVDGGAGGTLAAATYYYKVTALDGAGGETTASSEVSIVNAGSAKNNLSWDANSLAVSFNVYRSTSSGSEVLLANVAGPTHSYSDDGSATPGSATPPLNDTTQVCQFYKIPTGTYTAAEVLKTLPADSLPANVDGDSGGGSGGGGTSVPAGGTTVPSTSVGGVSGNVSPIPQMVQFTDKVILCLGNGLTPRVFDGSTVSTMTNTFVSAYPAWQASTNYSIGDIVKPATPNNHIYRCQQAGKSSSGAPSWPTTTDQTVADGSIIWKEYGADLAGAAPTGAAHGIVHAGALWVANTAPTNASDLSDGPSMLKMSDVNNPLSWNPVNRAYIGKDDGSQVMGLSTFSIAEVGIPPTAALVVFKEFSTYMVNGVFGSANFSIQQAQTDLGCIAPRSIQFVPGFGIIRLTHLGIAVFDGVRDRIISEEIRPYLFGGLSDIHPMDWSYAYFAKGCQTANPPMYEIAIPVSPSTGITSSGITGFDISQAGIFNTSSPTTNTTSTTYYRVTRLTSAGEVAVSNEFGPYAGGTISLLGNPAQGGILMVGPQNDADTTGWRVYVGKNGPGTEATYFEVADLYNGGAGYTFLQNCYRDEATNTIIKGTAQTGTPPIVGGLTRLLRYDLVLKAWTVADLPDPISTLIQVRTPATQPITVVGSYDDGTVKRLQNGDTDWDGTAIDWSFRTAEVFGASASDRTYFRRILLRGVASGTATINVTVTLDGADQQTLTARNISLSGGQFQQEVPIGLTGLNAHATISGSGVVTLEEVRWDVAPKPSGVVATTR